MRIGNYNIYVIESGRIGLDGGAMFGVVPKTIWQRSNPADDKNRIELTTRNLVLSSGSKNILIDTGIGQFWDEKFADIYKIDHSKFSLLDELGKINLTANQITDVILTHLHFDHTGGSVVPENNKYLPAFPNATYHVQKEHFEWACNPTEKDKGSFVKTRFMPLMDEGVLNLLIGTGFDDNISFIIVNGHTFAQQMVKISDGSETILYCADLMPFHTHIPLPYIMAYDIQPLKTLREKKDILYKAVEENWKLIFEHDPFVAGATIKITEKGFSADQKFEVL
ncbi:MAG: MBL fold metallo-hydrolase [Melioribacteraceae bacterium]|nr:MBL fold metallo-hydrolase [Melioribacteraceae bacterium]